MNHKLLLSFLLLFFVSVAALAQSDKSSRPSPPATASGKVGDATITINYSSPAVKGRKIWGELVPYGQVWRTGANETTTIEFSEDVTLEGKTVPKGKYALFTIPNEKEWTVILNKGIKWGAYSYKEDEDVIRVNVPVKKSKEFNERMKFDISESGNVALFWENAQVDFKVK